MPPGSDQEKKVNIWTGDDLYENGKPSLAKFEGALRATFDKWKKAGIVRVYPSVDLDGLQLTDMGYTGTDYSPNRAFRRLLSTIPQTKYINFSLPGGKKLFDPPRYQQALEYLGSLAERYRYLTEPYQGIPASWVIRALDAAKRSGFEIGLKNQSTGQVIVGDVTEYHELDYEGRTMNIMSALFQGMLKITAV